MSIREELLKDREAFWRARKKEIAARREANSEAPADGEINNHGCMQLYVGERSRCAAKG